MLYFSLSLGPDNDDRSSYQDWIDWLFQKASDCDVLLIEL